MWEPFTERARRSIVTAQDVAQRLGNNFIDAEHIFVGIVEDGHNGAAQAIASFDVTEENVLKAATDVIASAGIESSGEMIFTPRAKRLIDFAFQEARDLQNPYIGVEHLMLGYLRDSKPGDSLLSKLHLNADELRAKILQGMKPGGTTQPTPASLDEFYQRATTPLKTEELWQRLQSAAEFEDPGGALMYALLLARRSGLTPRETAEQLQKLLDEQDS